MPFPAEQQVGLITAINAVIADAADNVLYPADPPCVGRRTAGPGLVRFQHIDIDIEVTEGGVVHKVGAASPPIKGAVKHGAVFKNKGGVATAADQVIHLGAR
ncbi:hypothetical protein DSLASN_18190 [Desulfoluna limicola]|uniref:Uncharacterized protein n=1 Tax=Desulfoluna limicola TaxID=2810562 RepID=A0ABM7PGC0_9BACT|nr:hypothetical protein DSLASN_18190 [Desulfoluna limicola]